MSRSLGIQGGSKIYVQALDKERLNNNIGRSSTSCVSWLKDLCYDSNALYSLLLVVHESWLDTGQSSDGTAFVRNFFSSIGERCMVSNGIAPDSRDIAFRSLLLVLVRKCYKIPPTAVGLVSTAVICEDSSLSSWLRNFIDTASKMTDNAPCRGLAAQLTADLILSKSPPHQDPSSTTTIAVTSTAPTINIHDYTIEHKPFIEIIQDILYACEDEDHMVRVQAVGSLGNLSKAQWLYLHGTMKANITGITVPLHVQIIEMVQRKCSDSVG